MSTESDSALEHSSSKIVPNQLLGGRKRRAITLATKLEVVAAVQGGEKMCNVARRLGFPESTVRSIMHNRNSIMESAGSLSTDSFEEVYQSRTRLGILEETENQLNSWIRKQPKSKMCYEDIQSKAVQIYQKLKANHHSGSENLRDFKASRHWFDRFLKRYRLNVSENESSNAIKNGSGDVVSQQTTTQTSASSNCKVPTVQVPVSDRACKPTETSRVACEIPSTEDLREIFLTVNRFEHFLLRCDPDIERVTCVISAIREATQCYQQLLLSHRNWANNTTNNSSNSNESETNLYLEPIVSIKCDNGFNH